MESLTFAPGLWIVDSLFGGDIDGQMSGAHRIIPESTRGAPRSDRQTPDTTLQPHPLNGRHPAIYDQDSQRPDRRIPREIPLELPNGRCIQLYIGPMSAGPATLLRTGAQTQKSIAPGATEHLREDSPPKSTAEGWTWAITSPHQDRPRSRGVRLRRIDRSPAPTL